MARTPRSQWGNLFNFAGGGLLHMQLFALLAMSADNPTLFEAISAYLLLSGTFAARPSAANVPLQAVYFATDTGATYININGTWTAVSTGAAPATPSFGLLNLTSNQTFTSNTTAPVSWSSLVSGSDPAYWDSGSPTELVIPAAGFYNVSSFWAFPFNNTNYRIAYIYDVTNAVDRAVWCAGQANDARGFLGASLLHLPAGPLELRIYQNSGGDLDLLGSADMPATFGAQLVLAD